MGRPAAHSKDPPRSRGSRGRQVIPHGVTVISASRSVCDGPERSGVDAGGALASHTAGNHRGTKRTPAAPSNAATKRRLDRQRIRGEAHIAAPLSARSPSPSASADPTAEDRDSGSPASGGSGVAPRLGSGRESTTAAACGLMMSLRTSPPAPRPDDPERPSGAEADHLALGAWMTLARRLDCARLRRAGATPKYRTNAATKTSHQRRRTTAR